MQRMTLKDARDLINWTQKDLADRANVSVSTINRIENDKAYDTSVATSLALVEALRDGGLVGLSLESIAWSSASSSRNSAAADR